MSSCIMLASFRQRLAQVGTCLITGRCHRTPGVVSSCTNQRHVKHKFHTCSSSGPLFQYERRRRFFPKSPEEEYRQLVDEATGMEEKMEEITKDSETGLPIIKIPIHLEKRLERKMTKESRKGAIRERIRHDSRLGDKTKLVIHCKRPEFNYYLGQSYQRNTDVPLASAKWNHRLSAGDFFTIFPGFKRQSQFFMKGGAPITFSDLGISKRLCENLEKLGIQKPTHIQVFGIPQLMKGGYNIVAAETGCGKTLAYLLPIFHQVLEDKRYRVRQKPAQPSIVILLPSRELADQVHKVALQLASGLDITVKLLQGGSLSSKLKSPPQTSTVDIFVATTNALKVLTAAGVYGTGRVLHVVLDEADSLLDDSFFPELVGPFLNRFPWRDFHREIQLTLVSATMPKGIKKTLGQILKDDEFSICSTPGLHYILPHVPQKFLRLRKSHKAQMIKELVEADVNDKVPVLIFCNKSKTCDWLSVYLNNEGLDSVSVHGRMPLKYREGRVELYQRGEINVLISTDLASRGIDTVRTQHVINYEFPMFMADYIHRCGRTGRVGSEKGCHVTSFISRPGEVAGVNAIERSVRKERSLPDVDANIKSLYGKMYGSYVEIQPIQDDEKETSAFAFDGESDSDSDDEDDDDDDDERSQADINSRNFYKKT